jgi:hypothetical protein
MVEMVEVLLLGHLVQPIEVVAAEVVAVVMQLLVAMVAQEL